MTTCGILSQKTSADPKPEANLNRICARKTARVEVTILTPPLQAPLRFGKLKVQSFQHYEAVRVVPIVQPLRPVQDV